MKFDIVRAWKDETYRQTLSEEELEMLPANPAGDLELEDTELASAFGGWGPPPPPGSVQAHASSTALVCEVNVFTINVNALVAIPVELLSGPNYNCVGRH